MPRPRQSTRPPRYDSALACRELAAADPKLARLIARAGPFTLRLASAQSPFEALVESIVFQQLHGKAAATIHRRLLEGFAPVCGVGAKGVPVHFSAEHMIDCPNELLRSAGTLAQQDGWRSATWRRRPWTEPCRPCSRRIWLMSDDMT